MEVQIQACPECGSPLPNDAATRGLCPRCLIRRALAGIEETSAFKAADDESTPGARFKAPDPTELAAIFEAFEILELVGQGGMGAVYMARQKSLQRLIALKVIPRRLAADPAFVERFHREARTLARLNHPNIVTAFDFGQVDDHCFLVMEYVGGANLRRLLRDGPLPPTEAIGIGMQVCDALHYAHRQGVVHRDIKPENILLEATASVEGEDRPAATRIKIADFGLVRIVAPAGSNFTLTTADHILGTPQYMAPEQIERPQEIDHRVDIYALGTVLYEMLTGELPLGRFDPPSQRIRWQPAGGPVEETGPPPGAAAWCARLDALVMRCLEKDPQRRYQDADEVGRELESLRGCFADPGAAVPPEPRAGSRRWSPMSVALLLLVLILMVDLGWQIGERLLRDPETAAPAEKDDHEGPVEPRDVEGRPDAATQQPVSYQATVVRDTRGRPFGSIQLTGGSLKGDGKPYTMRLEFGGAMHVGMPNSNYYWIVESDRGWSEDKRLSWHDLRDRGTLRHTFSPPAGDCGPWEAWLEMESIGIGTTRQRVSNIIRFEKKTSTGEE